jgi:hypothetical protein
MTVDYQKDYDAVRRAYAVAQWELGDGSWADRILQAYFDPDDPGAREAIAELSDAQEITP